MRLQRSYNAVLAFLGILLLAGTCRSAEPAAITTPKDFFGFHMGQDYCLANYTQLMGYWSKLERESDRLKVVRMGVTEEGRPQLMGIVTSPANHRELAKYQDIARRLALAEGITAAEARKLADMGKAVVWIDGGLHASEVLCAQVLIETMYQLLNANDPETLRFLDDVIILFVHANPDGMELCSNWYMREADPKRRSLGGLPRLYQKYIGHDNNRDFYANTQAETKNMNRVMYFEWFPQIVYNHHQTGPAGTVLFCPPFRDPFNYNVDPLVVSGIDALGAAMMHRFLEEGKPGATSRSGSRYSTWWNGGLRTTCYFHNMIGLLTETIGNPTPTRIPFNPSMQLPKADYLAPIAPQEWHFRQSVDYSVTANKAIIDYASRHRQQLLHNIWLMGNNAIVKGNKDSWTVTPKMVEAARGTRSRTIPGRGGNTDEFAKLFRDPAKRDPRGFIIPIDQPDFLTATKFANILFDTGIKVLRAKTDFQVAGKKYGAGSLVMKSAQAFRAHLLDQFEPQDHPNDFAYPGAPPTAPYDIAGWTLAYQMGVKFDRILDGFDGPFEEVKGPIPPRPGHVTGEAGAVAFYLSPETNDSFRAVNRLLAAGEEVRRVQKGSGGVLGAANEVEEPGHQAGSFYIVRKPSTLPVLERLAFELGTDFVGTKIHTPVKQESPLVKPARIGLLDRYGGSMPSGWTRWLLERFEFPFQVVYPPDLDKGSLREKFDVLVFVDGMMGGGGRGGGGRGGAGGGGGGDAGGDRPPDEAAGGAESNIPAEYRGRRGSVTAKTTLPQLRRFLESGGTILTIGNSTSLANQLGLPLGNHLVTKDKDGKESALTRSQYYVPGSVMNIRVNPANPLAWGMEDHVDVMISGSPAFKIAEGPDAKGLEKVAWFDSKTSLRSGWAWGQEYLMGGVAVAEAPVGKGKLVMYGPQILFRAQPHGSFKFFFNGIVQAGLKQATKDSAASSQ